MSNKPRNNMWLSARVLIEQFEEQGKGYVF
jgi:hypothetical protein